MINHKSQNQKGGNNSTNLQANSVTIIQGQGVSYQDAKEIALDVFKSNFLQLSQSAFEVALKRAEEFTDKFLEALQERNSEAIVNFSNPSLQYALYLAQKDYAKTGDTDLSDTLIDILVDISSEKGRSLKSIVLEESLITVPKLTAKQLDILSLVFIVCETSVTDMPDFEEFDEFITSFIKPFTRNIQTVNSLYNHLIYTGCCNSRHIIGNDNIENYFLEKYTRFFQIGLTKEEFYKKVVADENLFNDITCPCLHDKEKFQIKSLNEFTLQEECELNAISIITVNKLLSLFKNNTMKKEEARMLLIRRHMWIEEVFDKWENSMLRLITLTSVGLAIGQANFSRKTGLRSDLGIWIKENDEL